LVRAAADALAEISAAMATPVTTVIGSYPVEIRIAISS
jgi:hypothetical protein